MRANWSVVDQYPDFLRSFVRLRDRMREGLRNRESFSTVGEFVLNGNGRKKNPIQIKCTMHILKSVNRSKPAFVFFILKYINFYFTYLLLSNLPPILATVYHFDISVTTTITTPPKKFGPKKKNCQSDGKFNINVIIDSNI